VKGFEFTFKEGLKHGLRRFIQTPRNIETMLECHNLAPDVDGLVIHNQITFFNDIEYYLRRDFEVDNFVVISGSNKIIL
jgi:hypothetical protein